MKQLKYKLWAKISALVLLLVFAVLSFFGIIGSTYLIATDSYLDNGRSMREEINAGLMRDKVYEIMDFYEYALQLESEVPNEVMENFKEQHARYNTNLIFTIRAEDGTVLFSNNTGERVLYTNKESWAISVICGEYITETFYFNSMEEMEEFVGSQEANGKNITDTHILEEPYADSTTGTRIKLDVTWADAESGTAEITYSLAEDLLARDQFRRINYWLDLLIEMQDMVGILTLLSLALCVVLFIFLLCAAGHKDGVEGIYLSWFSRIPFDLLAAALIFGIIITIAACMEFSYMNSWGITLVFLAIGGDLCLLLLMGLLMSFAARAKAGNWWRGTICWKVCAFVCRAVRAVWRSGMSLLHQLPGCWQLAAVVAGVSLLELILSLMADSEGVLLMGWILERPILITLALLLHLSFRKIEAGGKALAEGDLHHQIDTRQTLPPFRQHAEHLNHISEGMQRAVEQQMKSERTKTELITNVSHDIKTPLTSIVNYVGLMKELEIENDSAREYLDVLDRQSQRLKKLTEDLVEASKASAGSIPMEPERTDAGLLLTQALGEYEDRFRELQLEPVTRLSAENAMVMADGKLLWRVFDNLLSNICKYSLPGTRVYLNTETRDGRVTVSFKNISRYALDISSDELMERFVRGDSSRSTEGSGLGLSIARSLTTMQGGTFQISIDGDLFRADISFPLA